MRVSFDLHRPISSLSVFNAVEWATVQTLLLALECRDAATFRHSLRVAELAVRSGLTLGLGRDSLEELQVAGLLHDVGKIGMPDNVLQKSGKLSKSERGLIAQHPELSSNILAPVLSFARVREIIIQHHERYDGTGYPEGRKENEILIESRLLSVADAFDALCTERPYRSPLTPEEAIGWIESEVGRQFCPISFQASLSVIEQEAAEKGGDGRILAADLDSISRPAEPSKIITLSLTKV